MAASDYVAIRPALVGIKSTGQRVLLDDDDGEQIAAGLNPAGTALVVNGNEVPIAGIPCEAFGASPSASAAVNTAAIQAALDLAAVLGGTVTLYTPGTYLIAECLLIGTRTHLALGNGVTIKNAPGANDNMLRNRNWGTTKKQITAISCADTMIVTATCSAHGKQPGDVVFVHGVTPDVYNGIWTVRTTPDANTLTYRLAYDAGPAIAAGVGVQVPVIPTAGGYTPALEAAAMWLRDADDDIHVTGGVWDYNGANQTTPESYRRHCIYLRRIRNAKISGAKVLNTTKYAIALGDIYVGHAEDIETDTDSDGIHWLGSGRDIVTKNVTGRAGDDMTVIGQSDYWQHLDPEYVFGEFSGLCLIDGVQASRSLTCFKYYGMSGFSMANLVLKNIGGEISGGTASVSFMNDTGCVGAESGGSTIANLLLPEVVLAQGGDKPAVNFNNITITEVGIGNMICALGNTAGTSCGLLVNNGAVIQHLTADSLSFYAKSGSFSANASGIYCSSNSYIARADIGTLSGKNIGRLIQSGTTVHGEDGVIYNVGIASGKVVDYCIWADGRFTLNIGVAQQEGYSGSDKWFYFKDHSKLSVGMNSEELTRSCVTVLVGKNLQVQAPNLGIDVTGLAGSLYGVRGASFLCASAAYGTIQQNNPVAWNPAISKWVQLTDNSKVAP